VEAGRPAGRPARGVVSEVFVLMTMTYEPGPTPYPTIPAEPASTEGMPRRGTGALNGNPTHFRLATEAHRIRLAYQYDPHFAVSVSQVDPLPHQMDAVYSHLLTQPQIWFLIALHRRELQVPAGTAHVPRPSVEAVAQGRNERGAVYGGAEGLAGGRNEQRMTYVSALR